MRMRIYLITILILISSFTSCTSQTRSVEQEIFDCVTEKLPENGKYFKSNLLQAENSLIEQNIIKNGSGKSYKKLYEKIGSGKEIKYKSPNNLIDSIIVYNTEYFDVFKNCELDFSNNKNYKFSKTNKIKNALDSLVANDKVDIESISNSLLSILDEKDFELDYFKYKTFLMLTLFDKDHSLSKLIESENQIERKNGLLIYIDENSKILIDEIKISPNKLKKRIIEYYKLNNSDSEILIRADRNAMYKIFKEVQDMIKELKLMLDQMSNDEFNLKFDQLNNKKRDVILEMAENKLNNE